MKRKKKYTHTIYRQLVLFTMGISILPILLVSYYMFQKLENIVLKDLVDSYEQIILQYSTNLKDKLALYQSSLDIMADNTIITKTLMSNSTEQAPNQKGDEISEEVNKSLVLAKRSEIRNCIVYARLKGQKIYGRYVSTMEEAKKEGWYYQKNTLANNIYSYLPAGESCQVLSFMKQIEYLDVHNYKVSNIGMIKLDLFTDRLFEPITKGAETNSSFDVIVYGKENEILYASDSSLKPLLTQYQQGKAEENGKWEKSYDLEQYGLSILFLFDNSEITAKKAEVQRLVFPIIIGVIGIIILGAYFFTKHFSSRIVHLVQKIKVAETGDLAITASVGGNDEITLLDDQFNQMLGKLNKLIQKNYIQQLENRETELRNLQLQINPHFLYNTLETISSLAAVNGLFTVCDMCQKLGEIFRYSLGKNYGEFVTVAQELHHTQNYIFIQKIRYGEQFEVFYNIEVQEEERIVPRFILQPIVENAIVHGLEGLNRPGTLEISIWEEERELVIQIADDGNGMEEEQVSALTQYINQEEQRGERKSGIGIRNVNQRIKMICGIEYGIAISSSKGQGSQFCIRLPLRIKE